MITNAARRRKYALVPGLILNPLSEDEQKLLLTTEFTEKSF